jgi:hypothetical protein
VREEFTCELLGSVKLPSLVDWVCDYFRDPLPASHILRSGQSCAGKAANLQSLIGWVALWRSEKAVLAA